MPLSTYGSSNGESDGVVLTPEWFKDKVREEFGEFYDPCPHPRPKDFDGLTSDWSYTQHNYCNPPYKRGQIGKFVEKCSIEHSKGATISLLIPSYTDTGYFHDYIYNKANVEIRFLKGRIKFVDSKTLELFKHQLPTPLMWVVFS
tara:strand:- start:574 stop:1008 length:435 start_codon:yes stop_codon:yes gene_type:complete